MRKALVALTALLLLAGCTAGSSEDRPRRDGATTGRSVDVDTPALRQLKQKAGVQPCRPGSAANRLPDVTLPCLGGGRAVDLTSLRGPMVINLFAQWCGPCRKELPYYEQLHRKAKGKVAVVGVDYLDTQPAGALRLARESGVTYPLLADPDARLRTPLRVRGLPGVVLVGADGSVSVEYRSVRSYAELRALVRRGLDVRVPA